MEVHEEMKRWSLFSLPPAQQCLPNGVCCSSCIGGGSCSLLSHFPPLNSYSDLCLLPLKQVLLSHHLWPSAELTYVLSLLWPQGIHPFPWTHLTKRKGTMNSFSEVLTTDAEPDHQKINAGKNGKSRSNPSSWEGRKPFYPHFARWSLFYLLEH